MARLSVAGKGRLVKSEVRTNAAKYREALEVNLLQGGVIGD